jgi:putative (di)nucleoside polyphosphate hydrolase
MHFLSKSQIVMQKLVRQIGGYRQGAGAVIFDQQGRLLVGKRSSAKKTGVGTWQFLQGGVEQAKDDNTLREIYREIWEEIGLVAEEELHFVYQVPHPLKYELDSSKISLHKGQSISWFVFFWANPDLSKCKLDNEAKPEFTELAWMDWDAIIEQVYQKSQMYTQLKDLAMPAIVQFLNSRKMTDSESVADNTSSEEGGGKGQ